MSHNLSRRAARDAVLATPIGRHGNCILVVIRPSCRERRELRIELLLTDANRDEMVARFLARLRCGICRNPPEAVRLQRRAGQGARHSRSPAWPESTSTATSLMQNRKRGGNLPPISVVRAGKVTRAYGVQLLGNVRIVYQPSRPLKCGARLWIEADDAIVSDPDAESES